MRGVGRRASIFSFRLLGGSVAVERDDPGKFTGFLVHT